MAGAGRGDHDVQCDQGVQGGRGGLRGQPQEQVGAGVARPGGPLRLPDLLDGRGGQGHQGTWRSEGKSQIRIMKKMHYFIKEEQM